MTPQAKWAAETGLDPDDYSVWDNDQTSQRAKAHRWALARADEYCPEEIHIVTNRNCGCAQLVRNGTVATLDVDEKGFPPEDIRVVRCAVNERIDWDGMDRRDA